MSRWILAGICQGRGVYITEGLVGATAWVWPWSKRLKPLYVTLELGGHLPVSRYLYYRGSCRATSWVLPLNTKLRTLHTSVDLGGQLPGSKCLCNGGSSETSSWLATASMSRWILAGRCQGQSVYISQGLGWFCELSRLCVTLFWLMSLFSVLQILLGHS